MTGEAAPRALLVVFGNQLFEPALLPPSERATVYMAEDYGLCTYVRHHQQKIVLFLAAMRAYADELRSAGYRVEYQPLDPGDSRDYQQRLRDAIAALEIGEVMHFEIEDKPVERRLIRLVDELGLKRTELASPMFLTTRQEFADYVASDSRLLMGDFYRRQRVRLNILVDGDGSPHGGRWTFDEENRQKLPKELTPPEPEWPEPAAHVDDVIDIVVDLFPRHPGSARDFRWPTTRDQVRRWLDEFVEQRLDDFGPYQDALTRRSATVYHSLISPGLNLGLLTPDEVVDAVLARAGDAPLRSVEGFVRQIIGWREFVRGVYRQFSERQESANFWSHERGLTADWYEGTTGIPPLDDAIRTAIDLGWTHHVPRLMVIANLMTLCEIRPADAHRWFMEMYIDSAEWVMGPNVYGMGIFSDGGLYATKPYICGSNYLRKMSDYGKGAWCDVVDGLYWRFIDRHRAFFGENPRLKLMPTMLDRLGSDRKARIFAAAEEFLETFTDV